MPANAEGTTMGSRVAAAAWPEERPGLPGTSAAMVVAAIVMAGAARDVRGHEPGPPIGIV